jgi:hypothetical protein
LAALGAAEVFKWTAQVLPNRRALHRYLRFCPVMLSSDLTAAPDLASPLVCNLTQVGVGAIGAGTILLLHELRAEGPMVAVGPPAVRPGESRNLHARRSRGGWFKSKWPSSADETTRPGQP